MNSKLLLVSISIITLASCSTAYKTGQTPDDVYYSPVRYYGETREEKNEEQRETAQTNTTSEEREIRMRIQDRRWRYLDNDIYYNPYQFGYNYGYYYNPFYYNYPVYNTCACTCVPSNPKTSTPRTTNLGGYGSGYNYVNTTTNPKYNTGSARTGSAPVRSYNNSNSSSSTGSKLGNTLNKVFNNSNNSSNNDNNSSSGNRSYSPSSSSSSSSSGSSSSSSGSSSRPARSGRN